MPDLNIRKVDEGVADALTKDAELRGLSRETLIKQILEQYVRQIGIPRRGYMAYAKNETEVRLISNGDEVVATTAKGPGLIQAQVAALRKAELICQPKNGSRWSEARKLLESAGLEVYEL
jgi:hypothetical protein